ncbi:MAG: dihydropteroate synthase [bacterium]
MAIDSKIVAIVNITEDSFSDGGRFLDPEAAITHARSLADDGAAWIELGPASSNPDAGLVSAEEQIRRLTPVVLALQEGPLPLSVDATNPEVLAWAIDANVGMLNDIRGFPEPATQERAAGCEAKLVVVHSLLAEERATRDAATPEQVLEVLRRIPALRERFGCPVFISVSRKSFLRAITGKPVESIGAATLAAELFAAQAGADYLRTHDVSSLRDGLEISRSLNAER